MDEYGKRIEACRNRDGRIVKWLITCSGLLAVIIILAIIFAPNIADLRVRAELASVKAEGEPVCADELARSIPAGQNAAHDLRKVFRVIGNEKVRDEIGDASKISSWGPDGSDPRTWVKARDVAAEYRHLLPVIEQAASKPKCDFEFDWKINPPADVLFKEYALTRSLQRLLSVMAIVDAREGRMDRAVPEIELMLKVSELLKEEPFLIGQLVRVATLAIASRAMQRSLEYGSVSEEQAKRLSDALGKIDTYPGWILAFKGERAIFIDNYDYIRNGHLEALSGGSLPRGMGRFAGILLVPDEIVFIDRMSQFIDTLGYPYRQIEEMGSLRPETLPDNAFMCRTLLPVYLKAPAKRDGAMVTLAGDRIYLALIVYKKRLGSYPTTLQKLNVLGWNLPTQDLFSGKDFVYKRKGNGFMFYSIGQDLLDDGCRTIDPALLQERPMAPFPPPKGDPSSLPQGMPPMPPDKGSLSKLPPPGIRSGTVLTPAEKASMDKVDELKIKYIYPAPNGRKSADMVWSRER